MSDSDVTGLRVYLTVFGRGADEDIAATSAEDGIRSTKLSPLASTKSNIQITRGLPV